MLNDLDEAIKQLLVQSDGFDPGQVDISFEIPNREWSEKLNNRPTINCYLFDIHERRALREEGWQLEGRGTRGSARRSPPLFFELTYLITAWTSEVADEHYLLWQALEALMDHPVIPAGFLRGALAAHPWPIHTSVAQMEGVLKSPGEFWTALENQLKPSLTYVVILGRERQARPTDAPPVLSTGIRLRLPEAHGGELRLGQIFRPPAGAALEGVVVSARPLDPKTGAAGPVAASATSDAEGVVRLALAPGRYRVEAEIGGQASQRTVIVRGGDARGGGRYEDVVRDQAGQPIPDVLVEVEGLGLRTTSDTVGRFGFDLAPGRYWLRFQLDGHFERRPVAVRAEHYRFTLELGGVPSAVDDSPST